MYEHWDTVIESSSLSSVELFQELYFYKTKILFVEAHSIPKEKRHMDHEIVKDIDLDDLPFIALHLDKKHKIWTGDKKLIKGLSAKGYAHIFVSTDELKEKLYKKRRRSGSLTLLAVLLAMLLV